MLNGDLRGYSLADPNGAISGGSITLSSTNITVDRTAPAWPDNFSADDDVPTHLNGRFVLAENRLDNTGFTQVTLNSLNDIYINTPITTSLVRLHDPSTALQGTSASGSGQAPAPDLISLDESNAFMAGSSSFSFNAGKIFAGSYPEATGNMRININGTEQLAVSPGAVVSTAPVPSSQINPSINLSAPALVDMSGTLQSLGGQIKIATTGGAEVNGRLLDHPAPCRRRRRHSQSQETERRIEQQDARSSERSHNDNRGCDVRQHVECDQSLRRRT
jgi:hypothetical protein